MRIFFLCGGGEYLLSAPLAVGMRCWKERQRGTEMQVHKRSGDRVKRGKRKDENQSFHVHPPSSWFHFLPLYTHAHTQSYRYVCVVQSASHCCEHGYRTVTINVPAQSITNLFSPTACHQMWRPSHLLLV